MSYKYTIVQENVNDKTKTTFEFSANDEDDFVDNITSFMNMVGWIEGGNLEVVYEDDYDSEVSYTYDSAEMNPQLETYKNFEFPLDNKELSSTWPFPADRPSQPTYRVDSIYDEVKYEPSADSLYYNGA